jgi:hypothetical protein
MQLELEYEWDRGLVSRPRAGEEVDERDEQREYQDDELETERRHD